MSCIPSTPTVPSILTPSASQGWVDLGAGIITSALSQYYPLVASVLDIFDVFTTTNQHGIVRQLEFEETLVSPGTIKKTPIIVALYEGGASPTTPTSGAVYNPATAGLIGCFEIAEADYKRTSATVWTAVINPNRYIRSGSTAATDVNLKAVVLSNKATSVTYDSGALGRLRATVEQGTAI